MDGNSLISQDLIAELLKDQRIRIRYNAEYLEPEEDTNTLVDGIYENS